jgi:hypothetical protein
MIQPYLVLLLVASRLVAGFRPARRVNMRISSTTSRHASSHDNNPFREVDIDLDKAGDCANHFGKYPVKEVEKMRDGTWNETTQRQRTLGLRQRSDFMV